MSYSIGRVAAPLAQEINTEGSQWKTCLEHGEKIGLGSREYELVKL